jgi:hypothetical protein
VLDGKRLGEDVDLVVGFVGALSMATTDFEKIGLSEVPGKVRAEHLADVRDDGGCVRLPVRRLRGVAALCCCAVLRAPHRES